MKIRHCLLVTILVCEFLCACSQLPVYQQQPIPDPFTQGLRYPDRDEDDECRPIKLYVGRGSLRFGATIIRNTNPEIDYATEDARLMTSRMKSRLDTLARWYFTTYNTQLGVLISYVDGNVPGYDPSIRVDSLHFEGRSARISGSDRSHLSEIAHQAVLAGLDWVFYADQDYCVVSVIPDVCQTDLDLLFLLDVSSSVGRSNHRLALQFMQAVVNFYDIEANRTRVGVITFSTGANVVFLFGEHLTNQAVHSAIGDVRYSKGWTHTARALTLATSSYADPSSGARPISAGIPRVVVLITDGQSNHYSINQPAIDLKATGVTVYSVGIGNYDLNELTLISSDPDEIHVFLLQSYTDAASFVQLLSGSTCDTPANLPPGNVTQNDVEEDDFRYYQSQCALFTEVVIVEQSDIVGRSVIYASTTVVNPGPINSDEVTFREEDPSVDSRRLNVTTTSTTTAVYVSVRGITPMRNRFRMVVWNVLFTQDVYSITVPSEELNPVSIHDLNIANNANDADYFFNITEGNEAGRFRIDDSTGEIFLNQALDARAQDFYNLMVVAHLRSTDCRRGRVYIEVYVVAANENPPVFQATIPVDVIETVVVSTPVVQVTASDADFGMNSEVRYSITGGNTGDAFTINPTTGEISIAAALNHTIQSFYDLMLTATDQAASNPMSATITQRVNVLDVNQRPFFRTSCAVGGTCSFSFAEDTATNTILETITAGDPDTSTNAQLDFTFNPSTTLFAISSNGQISLQNSVDRETVSQYMFNLTVSDRGSPSLGISTAVTFVVTDVNDNAPDLTLPSQVSISENAFVGDGVLQASATDVDIGSNARISYTLITGSPLFTIDVSTGAVTLAQTLDYETDTQHFVVVSAFNPDGLSSPLHTATVLVINENDNAPVFTLSTYTASVAEGSSTGTPVVTVLANDQDSGVLGDVTYSITGGNSNNNFAINSTSGMITVSGDIDREVVGEYRLTVRAQDGGNPARSDTSTVTITVLDVNDNSPVFQRSSYSISVREDANFPLELQTLLAIDADEANTQNSAITYAIESGNVGDVFNLSRTTGMLTLVGQLDFEAMQSYSLTVIATDGGSLTGRATVTVTVIDLNDEAPQISGSQSVSLNETTSVGFVVAEFRSTSEEGEVLTFTIIPDNCFDIDSMTGVVTLAASLDYETQQTFTAQVSVTDGLFFTSATLTVNVVDENDNAPQITSTGPFTIEEEMSVGTLVGTILAFDLDTVGDPLSFSFVGTEILSYFTLNSSSGEIRTADILDRELLESVFPPSGSSQTYAVRASDGVFSSSAGVTITLLDINDNTPMFNDLLTEYDVLENSAMGVEVFVATATDDDLGSNAIVSYSISTSPFAIDTSTGSVTVAGILDYEMATEHSVTITASDGTLSSSQNVTIRVVDVNDNAPVFSQDTYTAMIVEHSSDNTTVTSVVATDDDSGANGRVSYSLANTNTFFSINPSSGEIVVIGDIDRETVTQFTFTVVATDGGNPAQRDTASVIVSVTDINDNAPTFQQSSYTVRVREDAATSSEILTVLATDDDETGNPNSQIDYSFQPDNAVFSISGSGVISLQATLDFENASSYSLVAVATDRGDPMMNGTTNVNIIVINVNDQPPEFSGDQNIELSELTPVPSQIARFTATSDNGEMITYSLSGVQNGEFAINATNGIVTLMTPLDYETTQFYSLTITASDSLFSTPSTLNITVLDENDNTPQFEPVNTLQIDEEQPAGTPVGQVTANDADSGANADLRYSFVQSSTRNYFTIDTSSGEITTVSTLDRELLVQENLFLPPASQITFQVQATDGGSPPLFSQIDVTVQLNDINDNPPQFINPPASVSVSESEASGFVVTTLSADDADIGQNAIISFSLTGSSLFSINSTSGVVTLVGGLDYETTTEYTVEVTASNGVSSTQHMLTVLVLNENDNSPIFTMDPYTTSVAEHSNTSTSVVTVQADDADSGVLGEVTYSITSGNTGDIFTIDSMTGLISVNDDIDRETTDSYTLVVSAIDGGGRSTDATVTVNITDINDNVPVFNSSSYFTNVPENTSVDSTLLTVIASDSDMGVNGEISYSIESGNENNLFSISATGAISLTSLLNFETNPSHTLFVQAMDNGEPSFIAVAIVTISVTDINDEVPDLGGDQTVAISEYTTVNSRIAEFSVSDVEQSDVIAFELSGTQAENFQINPSNGVITLIQSLDHEVRPSYDLTVSVSDGVFTSSAQLTVTVLDENDNTPQFQGTGPFTINEEMPANTSVGQVTATDGDSGLNGEIVLSIIRNVGDLFTIDTSSGVITTTAVLDREVLADMNLFLPPGSQQLLTIQAEDSGSPSLFTQVGVTVMLADINDNAPQFGDVPSTISFPENIPVNTFILDASATDADIGPNGEFMYSISSSMSPLPFTIDPSTGAVSTSATLDREQFNNYIFSIVATDNGALVQMSSSVTVNLTVTDINDNAPIYRGEPYEESIPEDASTDGGGSIPLVMVFATDADIGSNSIITYSLAPGTNSRFTIRSNTGELSVSGGINFEEKTEFNVTVIARDMGLPSLSSSTIVRIRIINVDEFAPDFIGSCDVTIPEDRDVSRDSNPVTQCIAVDQDSGDVFYDILIEASNPALSTFLLNQDSGEVFLVQPLDREILDQYQFTLQARSAGGPQASQMLVTINIGDVNDNAPVFNPNQHTVTYDNEQSQNIVTLRVFDNDINENRDFSAEITSTTRTSESHEIVITAVDMGTPSMSGSAIVIVNNAFPCELMEFSLDPDILQLSVATLCSLSNPPVSENYLLGTPVFLDCSAVSNLPVTYQWQRDGSFITNPSSDPVLDLGGIEFDDVGSYSCIARNDVGTIQSNVAFISVSTKPVIVRPPEDTAVEVEGLVVLNCVSTGIPDPTVTFFYGSSEVELDSRITQRGHSLTINTALLSDSGEYFCEAANSAGTARSNPTTLVVFSSAEVVTTKVLLDNPDDQGACHDLDVQTIENILEETTEYEATVVGAEGDNLCDSGPCYPNPCINDGRCFRNDNASGGYECTCPDTFTGRNCDVDIDECSVEAPCIVGTCTNTLGSFQCTCPSGRRGHRCQYDVRCDNDSLCTEGECVETLADIDGYICDSTPDDMAATINLMAGVTADQLEEAVYDLTDALLQLAGTTSTDVCEPRFIPVTDGSSETLKLIWACPDNTTSPSLQVEDLICSTLFTSNIVTKCVFSNGQDSTPPPTFPPPLDPTEVVVTFIVLDPVTSDPLDGSDALKVLEEGETLDALQNGGFDADKFQADEDTSPTGGGGDNDGSSSSGLGVGAIAGIVIALLIVGALVTVGVVAALYIYYKKHDTYGINETKNVTTWQRNMEGGAVVENPTFRRSVMMEDSSAKVFNNPAYEDAPNITKLDGNTKVADRSAINRMYSTTSVTDE